MRTEIVKASKASVSATGGGPILPVIIAQAGDHAACRFIEFFIATIHNPNTRRAYAKAVADFLAWAAGHGLTLPRIEPVHVAAYIDQLSSDCRASRSTGLTRWALKPASWERSRSTSEP